MQPLEYLEISFIDALYTDPPPKGKENNGKSL